MIYIVFFGISLLGTYALREYGRKNAMMLDIPNERSAHTEAVPRIGGIAIITVFYMGLVYFKQDIGLSLFYALLCAIPIAFIGLLDDIYVLSSKIRFTIQSFSAFMALYFLGGVDKVDLLWFEVSGVWLNIFAFIAILWITNVYNFLDGIDGYAAVEALTVSIGLYLFFNNVLGLILIAGNLGFLVFNWHKASIFMGDVGSATLGFIFSVLICADLNHGNIYIWMIFLSLFWVDATVTVVRRYRNHEQLTQAHKKHAYQRLTQSGWSHAKVVTFAFLFNSFFLIALYIWQFPFVWFVINMLCLAMLIKYIDKKKSF